MFAGLAVLPAGEASSCPPTDHWLRDLPQKFGTSQLVALALHIDYWGYIGSRPLCQSKIYRASAPAEQSGLGAALSSHPSCSSVCGSCVRRAIGNLLVPIVGLQVHELLEDLSKDLQWVDGWIIVTPPEPTAALRFAVSFGYTSRRAALHEQGVQCRMAVVILGENRRHCANDGIRNLVSHGSSSSFSD